MSKGEMALFLNLLVILLYVLAEVMWPARKINYKKVVWADFSSTMVANFTQILLFFILFGVFHYKPPFSYAWFHQWPFWFQIVCFLLLLDFGFYATHRFMHFKSIWRIHRWHHYPHYMYWGAGLRASIFHQFLFLSVYVLTLPIIQPSASAAYFVFASVHYYAMNNFMHMNVSWNSRVLEWFIVTPRYHHVHHSKHIKEHNGNYAAAFPVWDHLFRSYINPDKVKNLEFGTGEKKKHPLMFLGF